MIKLKESKESHSKEKLLNMKKLQELKEFHMKELSPTIMPLKLKLNTFLKKSNKPSLNMNQLKELGKEFNISQLKPKLFIIQKEIITSHKQEKSSKVDILPHQPPINKVPPTFQLKVELELKLFTKLDMSQLLLKLFMDKTSDTPPEDKSDIPLEVNILLEVKSDIPLEVNTPLEVKLDKPHTPLEDNMSQDQLTLPDKPPMLLEVAELEEKLFTDNPKLEVTLLEEVESDNIEFDVYYFF
jgi:hypothetical protein